MDFASIETDFEALMPTLSGLGTALETAAPLLELIFPAEAPVIARVVAILSIVPTAAPALGKDLNALVTDMKAVLAALH
jgi:hypothetical protein